MGSAWAKVRKSHGGSHGSHWPVRVLTIGTLVVVTGLLLQTASGPVRVHANGGDNSRTVLVEQIGLYDLTVISQPGRPKVGSLHLTFVLMDRELTEPVRDAAIAIAVTPPVDSGLGAVSYDVPQSRSNPDNYDITLPVEAVGNWGIDVSVEGALGRVETSLVLSVTAGESTIVTVVIVVLAFPLFLVALWISLRWRRSRQQKDALSIVNLKGAALRGEVCGIDQLSEIAW